MQTDALGPLFRLEATANNIGDHRGECGERISLRGDAAAARRVPARHITAGLHTRRDLKNNSSSGAHVGKLSARQNGVN